MTSTKKPLNLWIEEDLHGILQVRYRVGRTLHSAESELMTAKIVVPVFGSLLSIVVAAVTWSA